jgi:hypothetical protein
MSSDEESRNHLQRVASKFQVQDFQALVLPPVPVARGPNAHHQQQQQQQTHTHPHSHSHTPDISRRPVTSTSRGQHSSEPYPKPSNKGGVRGRVTVVCAEVRYSPLFISFLSLSSPDACSSFPTSFPSVSASRSVFFS